MMRLLADLEAVCRERPTKLAVVDGLVRWNFAQLRDAVSAAAATLRAIGCADGARAAIDSPNSAVALTYILALFQVNATWIPVNPDGHLDSATTFLMNTRTGWLFSDRRLKERGREIQRKMAACNRIVYLDQLSVSPSGQGPRRSLEMEIGDRGDIPLVISPTGGTTGLPKAVWCESAAWDAIAEVFQAKLAPAANSVWLSATPITYRGARMATAMLAKGATLVLAPRFCAPTISRLLRDYHVTHCALSPTAVQALTQHFAASGEHAPSLVSLVINGSSISPARLMEAVQWFGPAVCHLFGQTETGPIAWLDSTAIGNAIRIGGSGRLRSCGTILESIEVRIRDENGHDLPEGDVGEIWVRGPSVQQYYDIDRDRPTRADWHPTGDIGYVDSERFMYVVDRRRDMIVTGGYNVYPAQVEAAIMQLDGVSECAVVGAPHPTLGEAVHAVVVASHGGPAPADIIRHCKTLLDRTSAPIGAEIRRALPRTPAGKVDKRLLREQLAG